MLVGVDCAVGNAAVDVCVEGRGTPGGKVEDDVVVSSVVSWTVVLSLSVVVDGGVSVATLGVSSLESVWVSVAPSVGVAVSSSGVVLDILDGGGCESVVVVGCVVDVSKFGGDIIR